MMKLCETCRYGSEYELDKPCVVYRDDCPLYEKRGDDMTNEKAIEELKDIKSAYSNKQQFHEACLMRSEHKALDMAIKALEQEPCDDVIDRAEAMTEIMMFAGNVKSDEEDIYIKVSDAVDLLRELPSVNPQETVTEFADRCRECGAKYGKLLKQEPKTGHWIMSDDGLYRPICDKCGAHPWKGYIPTVEEATEVFKYCPNCGARMVESDHKCHDCKHYTSGEQDGSYDSYICEHYRGWESDNCN